MASLPGKHVVILCLCVAHRYHRDNHWNHPLMYRDTNAHWRVQEAGVVTTRYRAALAVAAAVDQLTSEEEGEQNEQPRPPPLEQAKAEMALVDNDSGIGSRHAHDEKEPTHAIAVTPGMQTITIKSGVLAILSHFYGLSKECPYAFLEEFCRYCFEVLIIALQCLPQLPKADTALMGSTLHSGIMWILFHVLPLLWQTGSM
ncbi:hypothetical protein SASPL_145164 [Salvia splendens]|uniref:Uncharacterized protein n=1 Tax=Salvia splendens TaxID=180675 RepID=A0A8X8WG29_SALSN|nr:hypothetical protein SASPL_145164 [Salvia splendens]